MSEHPPEPTAAEHLAGLRERMRGWTDAPWARLSGWVSEYTDAVETGQDTGETPCVPRSTSQEPSVRTRTS